MRAYRRQIFTCGWVALAALAWVTVAVMAHHVFHRYEPELAAMTAAIGMKLLVLTLALAASIWLIVLSLPVRRPSIRTALMILLWSALIVLCTLLSHAEMKFLRTEMVDPGNTRGLMTVALMALVYAIALAIPFIPGVEIGLMMMVLFGAAGAVSAWLATVASLTFAFFVGRTLPHTTTRRWFSRYGISVPADGDLRHGVTLNQHSVARRFSWLLGHRYLLLAAMLNFPGNSLVGGGGGLALMCGISRLYDPKKYLATVLIATSPVPLLFLAGGLNLEAMMASSPGHFHGALSWLEHALLSSWRPSP